MEPYVSLITIATPDLEKSRQFYVDGLGWPVTLHVPGDVLFLQVNHGLLLSLFDATEFNKDLGRDAEPAGLDGVTLAHNVGSETEVDGVMAAAEAAGAAVVKQPQRASWGGYHGAFADPCGLIWEVAHNPGLVFSSSGEVQFLG